MKQDNHIQFDNKIRDILLDHEEDAPAFSPGLVSGIPRHRKSSKNVILYAAASVVVCISFGMGYLFKSLDNSNTGTPYATNIVQLAQHEQSLSNHHTIPLLLPAHNIPEARTSRVIDASPDKQHVKTAKTVSIDAAPGSSSQVTSIETSGLSTIRLASGTDTMSISSISEQTLQNIAADSLEKKHMRDSLKYLYKYLSMVKVAENTAKPNENNTTLAYNDLTKENDKKSTHTSSWIVGGEVSSYMGRYTQKTTPIDGSTLKMSIEKDNQTGSTTTVDGKAEDTKSRTLSYSTSVAVKKSLSNRFLVRSGIILNELHVEKKRLGYIEIPLMFEYKVYDKRISISVNNGVSAGFERANTYPSSISGISFQYPLAKSVHMSVEPSFKHIFGNTWQYNSNFYGIAAGMNYKF